MNSATAKDAQQPTTGGKGSKQGNAIRARTWCFTENDEGSIAMWRDRWDTGKFPDGVRYCIGQLEQGDHRHVQGYLELSGPWRLSKCKSTLSGTAHWEIRKGSREQARDYCKKEDTRVEGPWEFGKWEEGGQGSRKDLQKVVDTITSGGGLEKIADDYPIEFIKFHRGIERLYQIKQKGRDPEVPHNAILLYGPPGCGKTSWVSSNFPGAYWKPTRSTWFDGYGGENVIVYDDFNRGWFSLDDCCRIMDRYCCNVQVKGGHAKLANTISIFTTNTLPRYWYNFEKYGEWRFVAICRRITRYICFYDNNNWEEFDKYMDMIDFLDNPAIRGKQMAWPGWPEKPTAVSKRYKRNSAGDKEKELAGDLDD